ncbi:hypothetical protein SF2457T_5132 [Shigella flexneri 2a str. 2457T]|nr:hypothetical protein SF2457T_5132 [Shigella flexneri 2a str. 2457T]EGJ95084.1 hypothetical protein SFK671_0005 [Shigella flexneri K-671]
MLLGMPFHRFKQFVAHQYAGEASFAFFIMGEQSGEICQLFLTTMLKKIQI